MSRENVESFTRAIEAFNSGDLDAAFREAHTDVVYRLSLPAMFGGEETTIRGFGEYREFYGDLLSAFEDFRLEISEVHDAGERVVGLGQIRARGRESGAEVSSPIAYVADYRDGKVTRLEDYFDPAEALEACGLSR